MSNQAKGVTPVTAKLDRIDIETIESPYMPIREIESMTGINKRTIRRYLSDDLLSWEWDPKNPQQKLINVTDVIRTYKEKQARIPKGEPRQAELVGDISDTSDTNDLSVQVAYLTDLVEGLHQQMHTVKMLPASVEEQATLKTENDSLKETVNQLEQALEKEKAKTIWDKLLGR